MGNRSAEFGIVTSDKKYDLMESELDCLKDPTLKHLINQSDGIDSELQNSRSFGNEVGCEPLHTAAIKAKGSVAFWSQACRLVHVNKPNLILSVVYLTHGVILSFIYLFYFYFIIYFLHRVAKALP